MPDLPSISGNEAVKIFNRLGFEAVRQKGSHLVLRKGSCGCVIPLHKSLAKGTLIDI
jgi:predicted RNA binding protein YcfA (HicA-like mRNA interferase family)